MESYEGFVRPLTAFNSVEDQSPCSEQKLEESRGVYNILFECCEMDLSTFFSGNHPPITSSEIKVFWTNLSKVVDALRRLHGAGQDTSIAIQDSNKLGG